VETKQGDFAVGALARSVNTPERNLLVVNKWKELCGGLPAIAFTVDVQHTADLTAMFVSAGVNAVGVSGKTPIDERRRIMTAFRRGEIDVISNCMVLTEGADLPNATVCLMARPTKSQLLFIQCLGRVLRPYPAPEDAASHNGYRKQQATIIDFVDNSGRHKLVNIGTLFGLRSSFNLKGKSAVKTLRDIEQLEMSYPDVDMRDLDSVEEIRHTVERVDLLRPPATSAHLLRYSNLAWVEQGAGVYRLPLLDGAAIYIRVNHLGQHEIYESHYGHRILRTTIGDRAEAFRRADAMVPAGNIGLLIANARWRNEAPTIGQMTALYSNLFKRNRKIRDQFRSPNDLHVFAMNRFYSGDATWSKGGVSRRIDAIATAR